MALGFAGLAYAAYRRSRVRSPSSEPGGDTVELVENLIAWRLPRVVAHSVIMIRLNSSVVTVATPTRRADDAPAPFQIFLRQGQPEAARRANDQGRGATKRVCRSPWAQWSHLVAKAKPARGLLSTLSLPCP